MKNQTVSPFPQESPNQKSVLNFWGGGKFSIGYEIEILDVLHFLRP